MHGNVVSAIPHITHMRRSEFLDWEPTQANKHEFWRGEVFAMAGARQAHVIVAGNCYAALKTHLRGKPCRAYISDMQLEISAADAVFYPDVFVSCHSDDLAASRVLHHPTAIVEVLSESTAACDRGAKFAAYRQAPSLREVALIDPDTRSIDLFRRTEADDWLLATHDGARGLVLASLGFEASLADVFEDLPAPGAETGHDVPVQDQADNGATG